MDLQWISIPFFNFKKNKLVNTAEAGYVVKSKDELKRRGGNSLVWEAAKDQDILYYHDSVLTLSQSSAKLYLKDQTELQLSENTLVTLEEPDDKSKSEIRLRFSRGDVRARNPNSKSQIQGDEWVVNLEKGSEISLRKDKDNYEFEVLSGQAVLQTNQGSQNLNQSQILKLNADQKIEKIEKSQNLKWVDAKPTRIYVFDDHAKVPINWSGKAKGLTINKSGDAEKNQTVDLEKNATDVDLPLGSYQVRLKDENGLSVAKSIEVWKAPRIFLKKPLPRDRLKTGEPHEFIWTTEPGVKNYKVQFGNGKEELSQQNFKSVQINEEQDLNWKVEGIDEDGFAIPAFYENQIYLRQEPLQAPKLKSPSLRKPSSWFKHPLLKLFFTRAQASEKKEDEKYEMILEWEPVFGADHYILEVSSNPDFRRPELIQNLKITKYIWQNFKYQKYYWRVASGSKGRMGLFSEPAELKPEDIHVVVPVEATKVVAAPVKAEPVPTLEQPIIEEIKIPSGFGIAWAPSYKFVQSQGDQNSQIKLQGAVPLGIQLEYQSEIIQKKYYHFSIWSNSQIWKPQPTIDYPFQDNLNIMETWMHIDQITNDRGYGLNVHQSFIPLRKSDESILIQSVWLLGLRVSKKLDADMQKINFGTSLNTSGSVHEVAFDFQYKKYFSDSGDKTKFYYGTAGNALYQTQKVGSGFQGNLILLFGMDQF